MKLLGIAALVLGGVLAVFCIWNAATTPDLASPASQLAIPLPFSFRLVLGPIALVAAVALAVGWIAVRRLPGLAWLALLIFVILLAPYMVAALAPSFAVALALVLLNVIVGPIVVAAVASLIARAVRRRDARAAHTTTPTPYGQTAAS